MNTTPDPEETERELIVQTILRHFHPEPHGGSWRINPYMVADEILAAGRLSESEIRREDS